MWEILTEMCIYNTIECVLYIYITYIMFKEMRCGGY